MSLNDTISYVAERCKCGPENASKAVYAALGEEALRATANRLIRDHDQPVSLRGYVDTGLHPVPSNLWAGYPWLDFDKRSRPRGNPMYRERNADGGSTSPVYSNPTIATSDIDAWLDRNGSEHKVPARPAGEERGLIGSPDDPAQMKSESRDLTPQEIIAEIAQYEGLISGILSRFRDYTISDPDIDIYFQIVLEIAELLVDSLGPNTYATNIMNLYNTGNASGSASFRSVHEILAVIRAAHTRLTRNPEILAKKRSQEHTRIKENVFIIHGRNEAKWRELKDMIANTFHLKPIILSEQPDAGQTLIEKFEQYAETCNYAIALFTPDDEVTFEGETYLQARPNVIYELGWFCGRLSRSGVMLLLKEGTSMFSDFNGIIQKRFKSNVSELECEIRRDLTKAGIFE